MKTTGRAGEIDDSAKYWDSKPRKGSVQILDGAAPADSVVTKVNIF